MTELGLSIKGTPGGKRVLLKCEHQNGILYAVPGEASWVCTDELLHVHALAGFMKELAQMNDPRVKDSMKRWGLYYREEAVAGNEEAETES